MLNYSGTWTDVTSAVSQGDGLKIGHGGGEISTAPKPSKVEMTFEDPDSVYRPYLATSPLYGLAGRNTPLLVGYDVVSEDFEDASLNITISAGASANPWARSTTSPHTGAWCLKSGATANSAFSDAIIDAPATATMCILWYRTDCQATDHLQIYVGDNIRVDVGGTGGTWTQVTLPIITTAAGGRRVYVRYLKDASGTAGADAVYIDDVRFINSRGVVEVSSWQPDRSLGFDGAGRGRQWTAITAEGLLRRLGAWTEPVISDYARQILTTPGLSDYWPMTDPRGSGGFTNLVAGNSGRAIPAIPGDAGQIGEEMGDGESPGGGDTTMKLSSNGIATGKFTPISSTGYQIVLAFKLRSTLTASNSLLLSWSDTGGLGYSFFLNVTNTTYGLQITDFSGSDVVNISALYGAGAEPDQWIQMRISISRSGGTVTWEHAWTAEGLGFSYGTSGSYSGPPSIPFEWVHFSAPELVGGWFGGMFLTTDTTADVFGTDYLDAIAGHDGETAGARFLRLTLDQGLVGTLLGLVADTELMGPQRPDTLLRLLQEIRDTDGGILIDSLNEVGVTYRTRQDLYAQTPALALTYGVNVAPPLSPVLDDNGTHNLITVTNRAIGSATVEDTTSAMGTAPPPTGVGKYKQEVNVNVHNASRLVALAYWWLNIGTVPDARYSSVTVDLDANTALEGDARTVMPGDRITIDDLDPDLVDLLVVAVSDVQKTQKRNTITYLCAPYRQYDVAVYDDTSKRYDSRTSTTNASSTTTATTIVVTFTDVRDAWSTTNAPYDWIVAGERIRVTSMGAVTGTGPWTQSATVTRSINGVVKSHAAGEPIHMHPDQQARYAL